MSNEIAHGYSDALTLYAIVYRLTDGFIYIVATGVFEAVGTWDDARADQCDIPMTPAGDAHFADFPSVPEGVYFVEIREQAGGSPDSDDKPVGQGQMSWDGATEINIFTEQKTWLKNG